MGRVTVRPLAYRNHRHRPVGGVARITTPILVRLLPKKPIPRLPTFCTHDVDRVYLCAPTHQRGRIGHDPRPTLPASVYSANSICFWVVISIIPTRTYTYRIPGLVDGAIKPATHRPTDSTVSPCKLESHELRGVLFVGVPDVSSKLHWSSNDAG